MWISIPPMKLCGYCASENWLFKSTSVNDLVKYHKLDERELEMYPCTTVHGDDYIVHHTLKSVWKDFNPPPLLLYDDSLAFSGSVPVLYVFILEFLTLVTGCIIHKF